MAPHTMGPTVEITAFTLTSLSTIVIAIRFYCRYYVVGAIKSYDLIMLAALLFTWGICVCNYYQVKFGTGIHMEDQPMGDASFLEGTLKSWYVYQLIYLIDLAIVKFSILVFYRSIATQKVFRYAVDGTMAVIAAFTIAMVFVNAFECPNPSDAWSVEILFQGAGSCINLHPLYYGQAGFNIFSDIVILVLPIPVLWGLQMHRNKRLALIGIFSVGGVAVVASCVRVQALYKWSTSIDVPYNGAYILLWSQIEINVAIISASIPSLKPLFKRTFGGSTRNNSTPKYYGNGYGARSGVSDRKGGVNSTGGGVALKSLPSSATMSLGRTQRPYHVLGNDSDEKVFFGKLMDTRDGRDDDIERQHGGPRAI